MHLTVLTADEAAFRSSYAYIIKAFIIGSIALMKFRIDRTVS